MAQRSSRVHAASNDVRESGARDDVPYISTDDSSDHPYDSSVGNELDGDQEDTVGTLRHRPDLVLLRLTSSSSSTSSPRGQGHSNRRLSDPGCRLSVHSLRDELRRLAADNSDESTEEGCQGRFSSINRIPDPRLDLIRSLTPSITSDAAGEEGEALSPVIYRSSRRRSTSYQLEPPRCATRRLSLLGGACTNTSFALRGATGVITEKGEALGAISMTKMAEEGAARHPPSLEIASLRRRSVSLEGSHHLDVIVEEKNSKEKFGRKLSLPFQKT